MDLRQMLNTDAGAAATTASPTQQSKPPAPAARHPSTPVQAVPPRSFRDYSQTTQASPVRQLSHDGYGPVQQSHPPAHGGGPQPHASSPSSYHAPASIPTPYGAPRAAPLAMGPDARSPSMGGPVMAEVRTVIDNAGTPFATRRTVVTPVGGGAGGYPFPPTPGHPVPSSPGQRHQYPPGAYPQRADSFSQLPPGPAPLSMAGPHAGPPYMQSASMPQTPPVGTPGGAHPILHQRSQSTQSTPTPTSAHSQHQYGAPYSGSPVMAQHQPPVPQQHQQPPSQAQQDYYRQGSQPPTPSATAPPPLAPGRPRGSSIGSYGQPPSPHQQRLASAASFQPPPPPQLQASPQQPTAPSIPRIPSNHAGPDADSHRRSHSRSERERSQSISPKTRNHSIHSSVGQPTSASTSIHESDPRQASVAKTTLPMPAPGQMETSHERAVTPGKRKLDDRDLEPDEMARQEPRPAPFDTRNGAHTNSARPSMSPTAQRKRSKRYAEVPVWARSIEDLKQQAKMRREEVRLQNPNFEVRKSAHPPPRVNGKREAHSRNPSPEAARAHPGPVAAAPKANSQRPDPTTTLGPWEPTITNDRPPEELYRAVSDFLFFSVITNEHKGEIASRNIEFEIEAKLGACISRDTNERISLPVETECVLKTDHRIAFRSSMDEQQHRGFNDFLNETVRQTHPHNPQAVGRVQVAYKHTREVDKFFELPRELEGRLPGVMRHYNAVSGRRGIKVRVTYERRDGPEGNATLVPIRQILKARVNDLDIHFPRHSMDCRISVNLEMPWDGSMEEIEQLGTNDPVRMPDREKDRLSYKQGPYQIDLTQVTQKVIGPGNKPVVKKEHELEIELNAGLVLKEGEAVLNRSQHHYMQLVQGLVDNVRLLVQTAGLGRQG